MLKNFDELESLIQYKFNDKSLLILSLTHPSYANENNIKKYETNQRLEFLGDAVLELVSSDFLYNLFNNYNEGILTKTRAQLVCEENLANVARNLKLYDYLLVGKGEDPDNLKNNNSTMCDTIEALIGAIYKDSNILEVTKFVKKYILTDENLKKSNNDFKSLLQEKVNRNSSLLKYVVVNETGPDHDKCFEVELFYNNKKIGNGIGKSKKEAEQNAAKIALNNI